MLLSLKINNFLIFNREVEFSMLANLHYTRFPSNVISEQGVNILKTAVLFGPNNTGKTNFINAISMMKSIMLNRNPSIEPNLFTNSTIVEASISFLENGKEYILDVKYDTAFGEYIYECFREVHRDRHKNISSKIILLRDFVNKDYKASDKDLIPIMKVASKNNLLIYLLDSESFPSLKNIRETIISFASKIDIVDMNNIPIKKTIDMMKLSNEDSEQIANFVRSADLYLDDFKYASDDEIRILLQEINPDKTEPQEIALSRITSINEMLHLVSVYQGRAVPSLFFDSTGTKKIAALASYVVNAIKNNRILIVDELDNSLHFRLTRAIISLFNNELNSNAQLIATTHDTSLLDCQKLFRKEQIWFTHKDKDRVYLYSLSDFTANENNIRNTSDLQAKYRAGVFGALPEPDLFSTLLEIKEK